jgi:uncharacterized protein (DUF111 family)
MSAQPDLLPVSPADDGRVAFIDATAGIAGDMLLGALVDAGADLGAVQSVLDALIPGSVRFSRRTVDRCGQQATKVDVELLVEDPPHRTWSSIRTMLETAQAEGTAPARTLKLAMDAFSRLADAEGLAHGLPPEQIHFHEVGALDSLADVIGACEAWRQLGIVGAVGSVIAVGSGRIRAAHGDIPVPVPAVVRLAQGWPTVAGELLPVRGHGHSHGHGHEHGHSHEHGHGDGHEQAHGHEHSHGAGQDHTHDHGPSHAGDHEHAHDHAHGAEHAHGHSYDHDHDHDHDHGTTDGYENPYGLRHLPHVVSGDGIGHSHSIQESVVAGHPDPHAHAPGARAPGSSDAEGAGTDHEHRAPDGDHQHAASGDEHLAPHVAGGPHAHPSRPAPAGVAPGIGELATPTGVALVRALAQTAGSQPALIVDAVGIGAGTKDTPGRPNVVRVMVGRESTQFAPHGGRSARAGADPHAVSDPDAADAHATPRAAIQLEANVDDLDPRLWPGAITNLLEAGALDAWLTPIIMKQGRPGITVHALVREGDEQSASTMIMDLTGSLGVRRFGVDRSIRVRSFEDVDVDGRRVRVKEARDADGRVVRREPEFRDVQAVARTLGITEREALERARAVALREG